MILSQYSSCVYSNTLLSTEPKQKADSFIDMTFTTVHFAGSVMFKTLLFTSDSAMFIPSSFTYLHSKLSTSTGFVFIFTFTPIRL